MEIGDPILLKRFRIVSEVSSALWIHRKHSDYANQICGSGKLCNICNLKGFNSVGIVHEHFFLHLSKK